MSLYCHKNSIGNFYKRRGIIKKTEGQRQQRLKIKDQEARRRQGDFMSYQRKENTPRRKCAPSTPSWLPEERHTAQAGALVSEHWGQALWGPCWHCGCPAQREAVCTGAGWRGARTPRKCCCCSSRKPFVKSKRALPMLEDYPLQFPELGVRSAASMTCRSMQGVSAVGRGTG